MGAVSPPDGFELKALEVGLAEARPYRDGMDRHGRMFREKAFDVCEQSLSSYIIARSRGAPFTACPVFPRRLFSQNCMYVNVDAGIDEPRDLIGKKVGINSFQTTLCVQAKGDLKFEYDVPWEEIHWFVQREEELSWENTAGVSVQSIPKDKEAGDMLVDGELDAYFHPFPPPVIYQRSDRVRRLFPDVRDESTRYFRKYGYCPIMHVMIFGQELVEQLPVLPGIIIDLWDEARQMAESYYEDPGYSLLLFGRNEIEEQRELLQADPWRSGLSANRANLEDFIRYLVDQGLIDEPLPVESLFHESVLDT
ncbi:MAG: taurine ABC transporter substrate-binding protein [Gammaproteobacteria bacterium]|nr:taurine ABC transporter substrate-binding protein [Gammaproteobacteria bacterium]